MRYLAAFAVLWSAAALRAEPPGVGEIKTLPGFKAEVVYEVPRGQGSWVCMTCDPRGRLVASDQYGGLYRLTLPAAGQPVRVERLATNLGSAQGLAFAFGSLYAVVNKKDGSGLYRARDTDGEDTFDEVTLLRRFTGDGEHGPHAVVPGPDGKSLYVVGGNGTRLPPVGRSLVPRNWAADELLPPVGETDGKFTRDRPGGWVLRTDPDGKAFDLVAIGLRNAYDLAFDRDGELFTYDSDMEWDMGTPWYRPTRVCHLTSGAEFGWRTGTNKWPDYYPDGLPAVVDIGAGSPTGVCFGSGAKFPAKYQRALFVGDWSYGRVYAVHLEPRGSSYTGTPELFLSGTPLPVTDLVVHPTDGALYFTVGGRGAASAVYRVTYHGDEPTTPAAPVRDEVTAQAREKRRALESFHGEAADGAITAAWPSLAHPDRFTRYAARVAVEHQPDARWREKALTETDPKTRIAALVALARCGDKADGPAVVEALGGVRWDRLDEDGRLDLVRAYTLAFIRLADPEKKARSVAVAHLDRHFPSDSDRLNRELCQLLVYLDAPGVVGRTLDLLARAPTQEEQLFYVMTLRVAGSGWTPDRRADYFRWFDRAASIRGGVSFEEYLRDIRKAATARLTPAERTALGGLLTEKPRTDPYATLKARPVVKEWKASDLLTAADAKTAKRDIENGRRVFTEARCFGCHRFDRRGGMTGPDLTGVAGRYDTRTLLESLLEPSKVVPDRYAAVRIATLDGRVLTGTVKDLTGEEWTVMTDPFDPAGLVKVRRKDVESVRPSPVSPMPAGLLNTFTEAEVLDLVAFLRAGARPRHGNARSASDGMPRVDGGWGSGYCRVMPAPPRFPLFGVCVAAFLPLGLTASATDNDAEARAILTAHCLKCHSPAKQKGGLRVDSRDGLLSKGDSGSAAVVPGKPGASEVIRRATATDATERMPPDGAALTAAQVATLRKWIEAGAAWPQGAAGPAAARTELTVTDDDRRHWAFLPLSKVDPPAVAGRVCTPIDRFILARLAAKGLAPAPPATREHLVRRVRFDLTGLPPTPEEVEAVVKATDPDAAYEALVDRLLASPAYGERWGRHWLDVARYADSGGYEGDHDRPNAYHFRDFVIQALNDDMPFDAFVRLQLAGDEYTPDDPRAVAATGFLAAGPSANLPTKLLAEELTRQRYIELDDVVATTGTALLGLTVGCARCHDHKFDPVPTRDYYRILAAVHSGDRAEVPLGTRAEVEANRRVRGEWEKQRTAAEGRLNKWLDEQKKTLGLAVRARKIEALSVADADKALLRDKPDSTEAKALAKKHAKALTVTDADWRAAMDDARRKWDELSAELAAVRGREPKALPVALAYRDAGAKPAASWLFRRGDFHDRTIPVEVGFLTVLTRDKPAADYWTEARAAGDRTDTTYQRRALAAWVTDPDRGAGALLARVIVNRVWQHHFGEGLVRTPNDFGVRGDRPSHPELLEWLAADLVAHGWKLKQLHRTILLSATYRQGTAFDAAKAEADPENRLLGRMRPRRLEAEALRDAILAASGSLNATMYGPAFKPSIPADAMVARNLQSKYPTDIADGPAVHRRSVYLFHKRVIPYPLFQAFDAPDAQQCTGRRNVTTVAPQALALLNDPFVRARAGDFADRLTKEVGDDPARLVDRAYRLAFGRQPTAGERDAGAEFLARQRRERTARDPKAAAGDVRKAALTDYGQTLFGLNEFVYVD